MSEEFLKTLFEKASNYDFLNHIIPGSIFCCIYQAMTGHAVCGGSWVASLVSVYFVGMLISRVGSLIVEPICKFKFWKVGSVVKYAPYGDFINAEKVDKKISMLVPRNNMYRTFVAMAGMLLFYKLAAVASHSIPCLGWMQRCKAELLLLAIFILFLISFRKQTSYIRQRVERALEAK